MGSSPRTVHPPPWLWPKFWKKVFATPVKYEKQGVPNQKSLAVQRGRATCKQSFLIAATPRDPPTRYALSATTSGKKNPSTFICDPGSDFRPQSCAFSSCRNFALYIHIHMYIFPFPRLPLVTVPVFPPRTLREHRQLAAYMCVCVPLCFY